LFSHSHNPLLASENDHRAGVSTNAGHETGVGAARPDKVACVTRHPRSFLATRRVAIPQNGTYKVRPRPDRVRTSTRSYGPLRSQSRRPAVRLAHSSDDG